MPAGARTARQVANALPWQCNVPFGVGVGVGLGLGSKVGDGVGVGVGFTLVSSGHHWIAGGDGVSAATLSAPLLANAAPKTSIAPAASANPTRVADRFFTISPRCQYVVAR